jgi:repressor of nif and glnA expression
MNQRDYPLYLAILDLYREAHRLGVGLGRGALGRQLQERGWGVSEQVLRTRLDILRTAGVLTSGKGRQATVITPYGEQALQLLNNKQVNY